MTGGVFRGRRRRLLLLAALVVALLVLFDALSGALSLVPDGWLRTAVLVVGGPGLVLAAPVSLVAAFRFRGRAEVTEGVVETCSDAFDEYDLTIRFTDLDARERVFTAHSNLRRPPGRRVRVMYDARDPSDARLYAHPVTEIAAAVLMFAMGVVMCFLLWGGHLSG
ncbi:hypothetical protein Acsp04_01780 [Actinomadura sp. NBRC 104425]|uniref:DUF3592 domain-containing protein n=1 Tax=Actinomadura sp. NBRC 104425 TaxID=3032204 RepID=UPI0024A42763|nr:DUF3592 domain-containing protein [Actinomadura sp. NBRC 104425]GLZ09943.1 hypothetical protein Acsp04_01780 [Actinomadura sp. NBRC 104425]